MKKQKLKNIKLQKSKKFDSVVTKKYKYRCFLLKRLPKVFNKEGIGTLHKEFGYKDYNDFITGLESRINVLPAYNFDLEEFFKKKINQQIETMIDVDEKKNVEGLRESLKKLFDNHNAVKSVACAIFLLERLQLTYKKVNTCGSEVYVFFDDCFLNKPFVFIPNLIVGEFGKGWWNKWQKRNANLLERN